MSLVGRTVHVEKSDPKQEQKDPVFKGRLFILDKVTTNMANYTRSAVMNNSPFDVYLGRQEGGDDVILFKPTDITKVY